MVRDLVELQRKRLVISALHLKQKRHGSRARIQLRLWRVGLGLRLPKKEPHNRHSPPTKKTKKTRHEGRARIRLVRKRRGRVAVEVPDIDPTDPDLVSSEDGPRVGRAPSRVDPRYKYMNMNIHVCTYIPRPPRSRTPTKARGRRRMRRPIFLSICLSKLIHAYSNI